MYALNRKGLKAGSLCVLNKRYALNNGVRLTTRVYSTVVATTTYSAQLPRSFWTQDDHEQYVTDKTPYSTNLL